MSYAAQGRVSRHSRNPTEAPGLRIARLLDAERVTDALHRCDVAFRDRVFNPIVTLWAFCWQVVAAGSTCREAVARVLGWRVSHGLSACSMRTGSYCQARQRLPLELLQTLLTYMAQALQAEISEPNLWKGRHVKVVDGTTVTMPDTVANQERYPHSRTQKPGLGWPIARLVVVFSLHTGAALDLAVGPYRGKMTGENSLFRRLLDALRAGEVVLADRFFSGFVDVALIAAQGADVVIRKHQRRMMDWKRARRLGKDDYLVVWEKPRQCPEGMDRAVFDQLPDQMMMREVTVNVRAKGFRPKSMIVVTTLLERETDSPDELADLYRRRWEAELNLRSLKTTMNMDVLQCKTPDMVEKELWMHMLAYNLVRMTMAQAGDTHGCDPTRLSFASSLHVLRQFHAAGLLDAAHAPHLLQAIAQTLVPHRPNRVEPRAVTRRPKPHKLLTVPRPQAREQLLCER